MKVCDICGEKVDAIFNDPLDAGGVDFCVHCKQIFDAQKSILIVLADQFRKEQLEEYLKRECAEFEVNVYHQPGSSCFEAAMEEQRQSCDDWGSDLGKPDGKTMTATEVKSRLKNLDYNDKCCGSDSAKAHTKLG